MKVYISVDIEGVACSTHWDETLKEKKDYSEFQEQMTQEARAACEGAMDADATEIYVKDAHHTGRNIIAKDLPEGVKLIRGWSGHPFSMVQELDETFQAVLFVGYHSRAGAGGNPLAHTITASSVAWIKLNGILASEFLLHTYAAALMNVPVVFLSGDEDICHEAEVFNESVETVAVKKGIGNSTLSIHPGLAVRKIRTGVKAALERDLFSYSILLPEHFRLDICFHRHTQAYRSSFYPNARLLEPHIVRFESDSYYEILRMLLFTL